MISSLLAKLYDIILKNKINEWQEMEGKWAKGQTSLEGIIQPHTTLLRLGSLHMNVIITSVDPNPRLYQAPRWIKSITSF